MEIVVNSLEEARAALAAHRRHGGEDALALISPPFAACHAGVNYYRALVAALRDEFPQEAFTFTLCCGDDHAIAYDARAMGFTHVRCEA
jgi:hypothetical protein